MIDSPEQLASFLPKVQPVMRIAIDTEADSLHAYPEKLCLIQLNLPGTEALVDPLAGLELVPLLEALRTKELVLHGSDYDLRLLYRTYGFVPGMVFDTMWAARLLGYREFGLRTLVQQHLGVTLEKGPQKMNWALRPLPQRMVTYAHNDTRYLRELAEILRAQLIAKGRLGWLVEVCARLIDESCRARAQDPEELWRIKGSDHLDPHSMAVLRELWRWREDEAIAANRPPYFILSHERMVALAAAVTRGRPTRSIVPAHLPPKRAARLAHAVEIGLKSPASAYPRPRQIVGVRLSKEQQRRFDQLKQRRDRAAAELELDPTLIASKSDLADVARSDEGAAHRLMGWQRRLLQMADQT